MVARVFGCMAFCTCHPAMTCHNLIAMQCVSLLTHVCYQSHILYTTNGHGCSLPILCLQCLLPVSFRVDFQSCCLVCLSAAPIGSPALKGALSGLPCGPAFQDCLSVVVPASLPQGQGHQRAHQVAAAGGCKQGPWQGPLAASAPLIAGAVCG